MTLVAEIGTKLWTGLNADITPVFKNLVNQIKAVYKPELQPVVVEGCIIDWIDARTGQKPWFS